MEREEVCMTYYKDNQMFSEGAYINGKKDGWFKYYYDNGMKECEFFYEDGKKQGVAKIYFPNGNVEVECPYVDDLEHGECKVYDDTGNLLETKFFCEGELIKKETANEVDESEDEVNHPSHYTDGQIEVIDYIEDKKLGYHLGNAIKYISRAGKKGDKVTDLKKAIWYLNREIERGGNG